MRRISWSVWCGLSVLSASCVDVRRESGGPPDTPILVVATVHGQHAHNPNYTYEHVARILDAFDPDVICVEIRPREFRREPYLKEMMLATVWGVSRGREVCGFDDWDEGTREERGRLLDQPAYVAKTSLFDSLIAVNPVTRSFDQRYGDFWSANMDYRFYNGREYNRYYEEWYRISLAVFGDSPMNLHYEQRNRRMMDLAWDVIRRHVGGRIALLTGAEHKHYFDRDLAVRPGIALIDLERLLPLSAMPLDSVMNAFLSDDQDLPYYESGFPADTDRYYRNKMTNLVHGPDMDWYPDRIPARNVEIAAKVLARWRRSQPVTPRMSFDDAWVKFLRGDCDGSVELLAGLAERVNAGTIEEPFLRANTYRNLGLCYDVLGRREDALRVYARARAILIEQGAIQQVERLLHDFETVPYARGRTATPSRP